MKHGWLAYVALGISTIACALAGLSLATKASAPASVSAADPHAAQLLALANEVAALRGELQRIAATEGNAPLEPAPQRTATEPTASPELLARLASLEASMAALARAQEPQPVAVRPASVQPEPSEARLTALDFGRSEAERLAALGKLRDMTIDGRDARSREVVLAMLDLAERSPNEKTRDDVYRQLHGVKDDALRDAMLRSLAGDPSAKVRRRAAEDIDTFLPDPMVEAALRRAAETDADANVRAMALSTLSGGR
ncbi:MAG: hypothetical protein EPO68_01325 [Planctomycetota bacterium]|nr:MAG: hypothetical protein EPO68_01325 [Planctomycetota bacterium]